MMIAPSDIYNRRYVRATSSTAEVGSDGADVHKKIVFLLSGGGISLCLSIHISPHWQGVAPDEIAHRA
jgi:hypothetical protein